MQLGVGANLGILCKTVSWGGQLLMQTSMQMTKWERQYANIQNSDGTVYSNKRSHLNTGRLVVWACEENANQGK